MRNTLPESRSLDDRCLSTGSTTAHVSYRAVAPIRLVQSGQHTVLRTTKARVLLTILALATSSACAGRTRPPDAPVSGPAGEGRPTPRTVSEAVAYTLRYLHEIDLNALRTTPRAELRNFLHGFQMSARYAFGLGDGSNRELLRSCGSESIVLEECLLIILDATWATLQQRTDTIPTRAPPR